MPRAPGRAGAALSAGTRVRGDDQAVDWARVRRLAALFRSHWRWLAAGLAFSVLFGLTEPLVLWLLQPIIDQEGAATDDGGLSYLIPAAIVGLALLRGALLFASEYLLGRVSEGVKRDLQARTLGHTLRLPLAHFDREDSGVMLRQIAHHVALIKDAFVTVFSPCAQSLAKVAGYTGLLFYLEWRLALAFVVVMPALGVLMSRYARRWRALYRRLDEAEGGFAQYLIEIFRSVRIVKAYNAEEAERARYSSHLGRIHGIAMRARVAVSVARVGIQLCVALAFAAAIAAGISFHNSGEVTIGEFAVFVGSMLLMPIAIRRLTDMVPRFFELMRSCETVFALLDAEPEADGAGARPLKVARGDISFRDVWFAYPGAAGPALSAVGLDIRAGERVALVGPSGSGKSTLVSLLLRMHDPTRGSITVDGVDIASVRRADLRRGFSWVTQEPHLFSGSIASNIAYPDAAFDRARVEAAAERADLAGFVRGLPDGLDSAVGEAGTRLSGGQRQRLSIARAIYRDAPALLLDEISSALDSLSEARINEGFRAFQAGRTIIVISHRLAPVQDVDRIVLLEEGRVACAGTHREMLEGSATYRAFCETQRVDAPGAAPGPAPGNT